MFNSIYIFYKGHFYFNIKSVIFAFLVFHLTFINKLFKNYEKTKIGVISCNHHVNIGNNLVKYSMFIFLTKCGYEPQIIGSNYQNYNISFLKKYVNVRTINKFSEIKQNDYKILIVNSDQSWRKWDKDFYDIAFLKFAKNWNINKFTYAVSLGFNEWEFTKEDDNIAKELLKNFTGISVRENNSVKLIKQYIGFNSLLVLDPTMIINKKYYLNIIKKYKSNYKNDNYIFIYVVNFAKPLKDMSVMDNLIKNSIELFNYKKVIVSLYDIDAIEKFLSGIYYSKAVITNSFHATIFSIIFKKPFISFRTNDDERLNSLRETLDLKSRIIEYDKQPDINLLKQPLSFNIAKFNYYKKRSIKYLKNHLNLKIY